MFDKIHILNNFEYVIEFSKKYRFNVPPKSKIIELANGVEIQPYSKKIKDDPLSGLNDKERFTAKMYLAYVHNFAWKYSELFGGVIYCSLFQKNDPLEVKLVKKGAPGKLNTYRVRLRTLTVCTGGLDELNHLVEKGCVPILGNPYLQLKDLKSQVFKQSALSLASLLAVKSLNLILPQTKPAQSEVILEARERLKDYLLPFWASMLSLAGTYKSLLSQNISIHDFENECDNIVDTTVRPKLIDIKQKMLKERKNWFYRVITPAINGVKVFAAKPPLTTTDIITSSISAGANVALDIVKQSYALDSTSKQAGLTFLIELDNYTPIINCQQDITFLGSGSI